jgi:hypothetical protein
MARNFQVLGSFQDVGASPETAMQLLTSAFLEARGRALSR